MNFSDHLPALLYLRNKANKWKNIAMFLAVFLLLIVIKVVLGIGKGGEMIEIDHIANIRIEGVIVEDDFRDKALDKLFEQSATKAVIVNINSPGGGIVGSEMLYLKLRKIAEKKPLIVVMESLAASGGYMASIAADYIIAYNGTLTGSIGVLMESPEFTDLASKVGVRLNSYKSSPLKGSPSPFEKESPEARKAILESISDSYKFFADLVKLRRGTKIKQENWGLIFDGRVFTGRQALKLGLIDKIGSQDDAMNYLTQKDQNLKDLPIKEVSLTDDQKDFFGKFFSSFTFLKKINSSIKTHPEILAIYSL